MPDLSATKVLNKYAYCEGDLFRYASDAEVEHVSRALAPTLGRVAKVPAVPGKTLTIQSPGQAHRVDVDMHTVETFPNVASPPPPKPKIVPWMRQAGNVTHVSGNMLDKEIEKEEEKAGKSTSYPPLADLHDPDLPYGARHMPYLDPNESHNILKPRDAKPLKWTMGQPIDEEAWMNAKYSGELVPALKEKIDAGPGHPDGFSPEEYEEMKIADREMAKHRRDWYGDAGDGEVKLQPRKTGLPPQWVRDVFAKHMGRDVFKNHGEEIRSHNAGNFQIVPTGQLGKMGQWQDFNDLYKKGIHTLIEYPEGRKGKRQKVRVRAVGDDVNQLKDHAERILDHLSASGRFDNEADYARSEDDLFRYGATVAAPSLAGEHKVYNDLIGHHVAQVAPKMPKGHDFVAPILKQAKFRKIEPDDAVQSVYANLVLDHSHDLHIGNYKESEHGPFDKHWEKLVSRSVDRDSNANERSGVQAGGIGEGDFLDDAFAENTRIAARPELSEAGKAVARGKLPIVDRVRRVLGRTPNPTWKDVAGIGPAEMVAAAVKHLQEQGEMSPDFVIPEDRVPQPKPAPAPKPQRSWDDKVKDYLASRPGVGVSGLWERFRDRTNRKGLNRFEFSEILDRLKEQGVAVEGKLRSEGPSPPKARVRTPAVREPQEWKSRVKDYLIRQPDALRAADNFRVQGLKADDYWAIVDQLRSEGMDLPQRRRRGRQPQQQHEREGLPLFYENELTAPSAATPPKVPPAPHATPPRVGSIAPRTGIEGDSPTAKPVDPIRPTLTPPRAPVLPQKPTTEEDPWWHDVHDVHALHTGTEIDRRPMGSGVNGAWKVTFGGDHAHADHHAIWKAAEDDQTHELRSNIPHGNSHGHEAAAWEVSHLFGLDNVPPTVARENEGQVGSVQRFRPGLQSGFEANDPWASEDLPMLAAFDLAIGNSDRHMRNFLVDPETKKITAIDHGLSFPEWTTPDEEDGATSVFARHAIRRGIPVPPQVVEWESQLPAVIRSLKRNGLTNGQIRSTVERIRDLAEAARKGQSFKDLWEGKHQHTMGIRGLSNRK